MTKPIFVECPRCGRGPRQHCRSVAMVYKPGDLYRFHSERVAAARDHAETLVAILEPK